MNQSSADLRLIHIRHHFAVIERLKDDLVVILDDLAWHQFFLLLYRHLKVEIDTRHRDRCLRLNLEEALFAFGALFPQR